MTIAMYITLLLLGNIITALGTNLWTETRMRSDLEDQTLRAQLTLMTILIRNPEYRERLLFWSKSKQAEDLAKTVLEGNFTTAYLLPVHDPAALETVIAQFKGEDRNAKS